MKLAAPKLLNRIKPLIAFVQQYAAFIFILAFLGSYVFLVHQIGTLIQQEPSQTAIDDKLKPVDRLKVDEDAVQQITELEQQNIEVQSLFDQARQNPFTE